MIKPLLILLLIAVNPAGAQTLFQPVTYGELPTTGKSFGATWADIDQDGHLDFLLGRHGKGVGLYFNGPGLHFVRQDSCAYLPCQTIDQHGVAACDFDADGDWDLYVTVGADRGHGAGPNQMWTRGTDGIYGNILSPTEFMADSHGRGRGATWVRLDNDRYPELLVLNFKTPARLYHFDGHAWVDISTLVNPLSTTVGIKKKKHAGHGPWFSVVVPGDLDRDGRTDLFLAGDGYFLFHNQGADSLVNVTAAAGLPRRGRILVHAVSGDVDNDGDLDLLFVHRWVDGLKLWLNESEPGQIRFRPGPDLTHLALSLELDSALLADLDNDGILDLYVMMQDRMQNNRPNLLARGLGNGDFTEVSAEWGGRGAVEALPRGAWPVDLDQDGDLDLMLIHGKENFPTRKGITVLYENTTANPGLTLTLHAKDGIPHGMGAEVVLHTRTGTQTRQVHSVINHWNSTILPLHFGLGDDPGPYRVDVHWPDGYNQTAVLPRGQVAYRLTEGVDSPKPVVDIRSQ